MYIKVTVTAGSKKELLVKKSETRFDVFVREKSERNMANTRMVELVALHFRIPTSSVRIINGHREPRKMVSVGVDNSP